MNKMSIVILIIVALSIQSKTLYDLNNPETYTRDCVVLEKIDYIREHIHKYHASYYPKKVFHVKWLDNNREDEVSVSIDTFYNYKIGEQISFSYDVKPNWTFHLSICVSALLILFEIIAVFILFE